ncbi:MAG TPA: hypothetical protein PLV85_24095 [Polyangiaceae bacterium]|nr:hypothetical protein [Polyangiaceae bacterium]
MSKPLFWTCVASLSVAMISLVASGWVITNDRKDDEKLGLGRVWDEPEINRVEAGSSVGVGAKTAQLGVSAKSGTVSGGEVEDSKTSEESRANRAELRVLRLVVAHGVRHREPLDEAESFVAGTRPVYAFVELANQSDHPGEIVVDFEKGTTKTGNVGLAVPSNTGRYRTWAYFPWVAASGKLACRGARCAYGSRACAKIHRDIGFRDSQRASGGCVRLDGGRRSEGYDLKRIISGFW